MNSATLNAEPQKSFPVILIVDKVGIIGEALAREFAKDYLVVFLSAADIKKEKNIIPVKFKKRIPQVPEAKYKKIFLVDDGGSITRQSAFSFIKIAREFGSPLYFIGSLRNTDVEHADSIAAEYTNSKVLIFGDIFDKKIFFDKDASVSRYIIEARKLGKIEVPGSGLSLSFPITFDDTIKLIIKATTINVVQKVILLFYPHPITDISLANVFQRVNPELKVDFGKGKKELKIYYPQNAVHAISKYDLDKKIKELDLEEKENRELKVINKERKYKNRIFKPVLFFILACLFLSLLPFFSTVAYTKLGQWETSNAVASAGKGDFKKAYEQTSNSITFYNVAEKTAEPLIAEAELLGMKRSAEKLKEKVIIGRSISNASLNALDGLGVLSKIYDGSSVRPAEDFARASNDFKSALAVIAKLKAEGDLPAEFTDKLDNLEPFTDIFTNSVDILPEILGFENEKKYLVLFENNNNLRPGGGEIDSLGEITIKNARIIDFKILEPKLIDSEIKLDTDSPFEYRRFMGEEKLLIKDSLSSPDFVKSAITASTLFSKSSGGEVDGVIGVDGEWLKSVLDLVGGVVVDEKNITSVNLDTYTDKESGLMAKIAAAVKQKVEGNNISLVDLTVGQGSMIKQKHLNFAFKDIALQNIFTANGWSSAMWDNREDDKGVINDYLGISEANMGKNYVNDDISRSIEKTVFFQSSGTINSNVKILYKNSSQTDSYANYLKLVLPLGSSVNSINIDGKKVNISPMQADAKVFESINFKVPTGLEVDQRTELGKSLFGMFLNIPKGSSKNILINYSLPFSFNSEDSSILYSLKYLKQPGTDATPFDLRFSIPENYQIVGENTFTDILDSDVDLEYTISRK